MSLSAVVSLIMVFTLNSLVSSAHFYEASSYQGLVEVALGGPLGKMASTIMGMTICFYIFGALIGYLMVVGDVIPPFVGLVVGAESFWAQRWVVITLVGTLVSLPISCVHNLSALTSTPSP
jgi:amino acid permease